MNSKPSGTNSNALDPLHSPKIGRNDLGTLQQPPRDTIFRAFKGRPLALVLVQKQARCAKDVLEERRGGSGTQKFVYQKWPDKIFPMVNFVFSHYRHFGRGGREAPPTGVSCSDASLWCAQRTFSPQVAFSHPFLATTMTPGIFGIESHTLHMLQTLHHSCPFQLRVLDYIFWVLGLCIAHVVRSHTLLNSAAVFWKVQPYYRALHGAAFAER